MDSRHETYEGWIVDMGEGGLGISTSPPDDLSSAQITTPISTLSMARIGDDPVEALAGTGQKVRLYGTMSDRTLMVTSCDPI